MYNSDFKQANQLCSPYAVGHGCAKIHLVNFVLNAFETTLAKFFPSENYLLYNINIFMYVHVGLLGDI